MRGFLLAGIALALCLSVTWLIGGGEELPAVTHTPPSANAPASGMSSREKAPADVPAESERVELDPAAQAARKPRSIVLQGRVVAPDDAPVGGASVRLFPRVRGSDQFPLAESTSKEDGTFSLSVRPAWGRTLEVTAEADGFIAGASDVQPGEDIVITLGWTAEIHGQVVEEASGVPIAGATLACSDRIAVTSADGSYRLAGIPVGLSVHLRASKSGYGETTERLYLREPPPEGHRVDLRLRRGIAIPFVVVDRESGAPIPGALVFDRHVLPRRRLDPAQALGRTDAAGRFEIWGVAGQPTGATIRAKRYCVSSWRFDPADVSDTPPRVPMTGLGWIEGIVTDAGGAGLGDARLRARNVHWGEAQIPFPWEQRGAWGILGSVGMVAGWHRRRTNPDGTFRLAVVPDAKPYRVVVERYGFLPRQSEPVLVPSPGSSAWVEVAIQREALIRGRVTRDGVPWQGRVIRYDVESDAAVDGVETDRNGRYELKRVPAGKVRLTVSHSPSPEFGSEVHVTAIAGKVVRQDIHFQSNTVSLTGRVTAPSGRELEGVTVVAHVDGISRWPNTRTDETGSYSLELPPGPALAVSAQRGPVRERREGVRPGSENVDFVLPETAVLRVRLVDALTGLPIRLHGREWARVTWKAPTDSYFHDASHAVDVDGIVEWEAPVGVVDIKVAFNQSGYATRTVEGVVVRADSAAPVDVLLQPAVDVVLYFQGDVDWRGDAVLFALPPGHFGNVRVAGPGDDASRVRDAGGVPLWVGDGAVWNYWLEMEPGNKARLRGVLPAEFTLRAFPDTLAFEPSTIELDTATESVEIQWSRKQK